MNINEQKTALCYFLQIQDSDIFYLKIWIRDKNSLFAPLLTGQYFCCWFSPHPYFMFLLCLLPHSGSILDSQLSWESGKFQLARWSHEVVIFPEGITHPPTWPDRFLPHSGSILDSQLSCDSCKFQLVRWSHEVAILCSWNRHIGSATNPPDT